MSYDLALNRLDHDMVFKQVSGVSDRPVPNPLVVLPDASAVPKYSIWPINKADKVAQQIKITLLAFLGEWFLDVTFGVPYLEEILIKSPRMSSVESILRSHIAAVPDVDRVTSLGLSWDRQTRILSVAFTATTGLDVITDSIKLEVMRHV